MLLTTCPGCAAQFRVQPEQLNVRQGRVMCGRCRNVFNAFESLKRIEDDDAHLAAPPKSPQALQEETAEFPTLSTDNLEALAPEAPPEFTESDNEEILSSEDSAPSPIGGAGEDLSDRDNPGEDARSLPEIAEVVNPPPAFLLADADDAGDNAGAKARQGKNPLLQTSYRTNQSPRNALWAFGILLLLAFSIGQSAFLFRASLMENFPQSRPWLVRMCEIAGCNISWGRDETAIRIEASDLIESPAKPGRILLTATMVNRGKLTQELPALELRLTDSANQVLSSRILQPRDYLGRTPTANEIMAPGAELFINLNFEIANKAPASGYGLRAFYP